MPAHSSLDEIDTRQMGLFFWLITLAVASASLTAKQLNKEEADFYCSETSQATAVVLYEFAQGTSKRKARLRLNEWWEERTRKTQLTPIHDLDSAKVSLILNARNNSQALRKQIHKANNKDQKAELSTLRKEELETISFKQCISEFANQ